MSEAETASKVGERGRGGLGVHEVGRISLVFNMFYGTTSNFGGLSPPYQKVGEGGSSPPAPHVLCIYQSGA